MYIWLAIDMSEQLADLRKRVSDITADLGVSNPSLTLPPHISLRISFDVDEARAEQIIEKVRTYFQSLKPFSVTVEGMEKFQSIVWLRVQENDALQRIHSYLIGFTQREYGIQPHMFDMGFRYHASLLTGSDPAAADRCFGALRQFPVPDTLPVNKFLIGTSQTGRADDYRVIQTILI